MEYIYCGFAVLPVKLKGNFSMAFYPTSHWWRINATWRVLCRFPFDFVSKMRTQKIKPNASIQRALSPPFYGGSCASPIPLPLCCPRSWFSCGSLPSSSTRLCCRHKVWKHKKKDFASRKRERLLFFNCHLPYLRQLFRTSSACLQLPIFCIFVFHCNCCSCRDVLRISGLTLTRCGLPENNKQTLASVIALPAILSVGVCKRRAQ